MSETTSTSIRLKPSTKDLLDQHKVIDEEPYDRVIIRLATLAKDVESNLDTEGRLRPEYIAHLQKRLQLRAQDRVVSHDAVVQRMKQRQRKKDGQTKGVRNNLD